MATMRRIRTNRSSTRQRRLAWACLLGIATVSLGACGTSPAGNAVGAPGPTAKATLIGCLACGTTTDPAQGTTSPTHSPTSTIDRAPPTTARRPALSPWHTTVHHELGGAWHT